MGRIRRGGGGEGGGGGGGGGGGEGGGEEGMGRRVGWGNAVGKVMEEVDEGDRNRGGGARYRDNGLGLSGPSR